MKQDIEARGSIGLLGAARSLVDVRPFINGEPGYREA